MNEEVKSISFDSCLEALGHVERRQLLLALLDDTSDGSRTVALDQLDSAGDDERMRVSLHHVHLPKLSDMGFIDTGQHQRSVTAGPRFTEIQPLLELLVDNQSHLPDGWAKP